AANKPGQYQLQAAIQAVHCDAVQDEDTDWRQILALYDMLLPMVPTTAVHTARLVALSHAENAEAALDQIDPESDDHYVLAVRADLLARLGDTANAQVAFQRAASGGTSSSPS
ncbi:RNA polymerase sigma factor, partial [Nocardia sp. NPDC059091]